MLNLALRALLLSVVTLGTSVAAEPTVKTTSGLLQGVPGRDASITVFKGVPYAAPPIGELRWQPPASPASWRGVRKADRFGSSCPQLEMRDVGPMSEDCLYLNVWTGTASASARRPVFVWIYGGGFSGGSGSSPQFDGESLARKGLVVVTFNYRLGALGFLATPALSQESGHKASGNYGLLDDIAVLQWVQRNIAAFGGDPKRVTIGGQSAGAGSVGFLSMSPLAKGLFHRSIAQSHARHPRDLELRYLSVSWRPLQSAEQAGAEYARSLGASSLKELRALPWQTLIVDGGASDNAVFTGSGAKPPLFRPVVDGWVIPSSYNDSYEQGTQNEVFYLAGNNLDETGAVPESAFDFLRSQSQSERRPGSPQPNVTLADFQRAARQKFGAMADEFLQLYPATNDNEAARASNAAARDNSRVSTYLWGTLWTKHATQPVYTYFWVHRPPGPQHERRGAYHGSEIAYVFNNPDSYWSEQDRDVGERMSSYWANYVATGNPNGAGLPRWPAYDPQSPTVMQLGEAWAPIPVASPEKLDFWRRFFQTQDAW